eukprot:4328166-Prymnesium_polylepis.2
MSCKWHLWHPVSPTVWHLQLWICFPAPSRLPKTSPHTDTDTESTPPPPHHHAVQRKLRRIGVDVGAIVEGGADGSNGGKTRHHVFPVS